jgi:hypothetical protein
MDKKIYSKKNVNELKNELLEYIDYIPENAEKLIDGWLKLKNPPMAFFKAFWLAVYEEGLWGDEEEIAFRTKLVESNKFNVIDMMISFQLFEIEDFYYTSINSASMSTLNYLIHEEKFFLTPEKAADIYLHSFTTKNTEFFYQVQELFTQHTIFLEDPEPISNYNIEKILTLILESGQSEYVKYIDQKFNLNLEEVVLINFFGPWEKHLRNGLFFKLDTENQVNFINLVAQVEKRYKKEDIIETYVSNAIRQDKINVAIEVFYELNQGNMFDAEFFREKVVFMEKKEFLNSYDIYAEKRLLDEKLTQDNKPSTKKLKV